MQSYGEPFFFEFFVEGIQGRSTAYRLGILDQKEAPSFCMFLLDPLRYCF